MTRVLGALFVIALAAGGVLALITGAGLRFHIENTDEALAGEAQGAVWLLVAAILFLAAAITAATIARARRWAALLVASPTLLGVAMLLMLPGNIVPFGTAAVSIALCTVGAIAALAAPRRSISTR